MRLLLVEDDDDIAAIVAESLAVDGHAVDRAADGTDGLWMAREGAYGLVVLDLLLPGLTGYQICERLRAEGFETPILMLTAKVGEYDETDGFEVGADDYLRKPFSPAVLRARVQALLRRAPNGLHADELCRGPVVLDPARRVCSVHGEPVELTGREAQLLEALLRAGHTPVDRFAAADHRVGSRLRRRHQRGGCVPSVSADQAGPRHRRERPGPRLPDPDDLMRQRARSLRTRVTVAGMATLAVVLGLGAWLTVAALSRALQDDLASQNEEVLDSLAEAIAEGANPATLRMPLGADGTEFAILDADGRLVNASIFTVLPPEAAIISASPDDGSFTVIEGIPVAGVPVIDGVFIDPTDPAAFPIPNELVGPVEFGTVVSVAGELDENDFVEAADWFETTRSVATPDGTELTLQAYSPLGIIDRSIDRLALTMGILVPVLTLVGGLLLWRAVGAALAPVRRITDEARRIAPSNSGDRLPVPTSGDEIAALTVTLNDMLDRLDAGLTRQRQFVSDASHELRSPLTVVQGAAELLDDQKLEPGPARTVESLRRATTRLASILDDLTELASTGEPVPRRDLDLDDLIRAEVALAHSAADIADGSRSKEGEGQPVAVELSGLTPLVVHANEVQLARAVHNLVANALRHATATVAVSSRTTGDGVEIVVDDDGPGVPVEERERVFERFVRLDDGRSRQHGGTGLGLALVASIAADHGGTVTCTESPLGGARFLLHLPQ